MAAADSLWKRTPWEALSDDFKESNDSRVDDIPAKLVELGYALARGRYGEAVERFTDAEIEMLAKLEHERFEAERRMSGWVLGPKDKDRRISPYLVPWFQLAETVRDVDRAAV